MRRQTVECSRMKCTQLLTIRTSIMTANSDTDVVVKGISVFDQFNIEKLWVAFGKETVLDGFLYKTLPNPSDQKQEPSDAF